ncbi:hypothetical protein [Novosphingobium sp. SG720]|uniref:hypothetical protein n=1 Tax=Novosphingobium TaxID=165696 RepID=UPI001447829E|nr:hypothetical protein [Novosphingobium sp. SG720]NKJ43768.1 hypothetical protein [Novosphingobium sp. SG720]
MEADFAKRMASMSDVDLVRIAADVSNEGFEPAAVAAAEMEIARRAIPEHEIEQAIDDYNDHLVGEGDREFRPLSAGGWILAVVFGPILALSVGMAIALRIQGYRRMSNQVFASIGLSYLLIFVVVVASDIFGF